MNEAQTRFNKIDPKLRDAGWGIVPGSKILVELVKYSKNDEQIFFQMRTVVVALREELLRLTA